MKEFVFVDFVGLGVVADEDHFGLVVVPAEEQVEQDEEALGDVLACLVHRARNVHHAEHHGFADRLRHLHTIAIAQVDRIEIGNAAQAAQQAFDLRLESRDFVG